MKSKLIALYVSAGLAIFLIGRFSAPKKTEFKEVERVVYREQEQRDRSQNVVEVEKETRLPDGTIITEKKRTKETETHTERESQGTTERITESKVETRADWLIGVAYQPFIARFQTVHYTMTLERRLVGELYAGVTVGSDRTVGVSVSLGF